MSFARPISLLAVSRRLATGPTLAVAFAACGEPASEVPAREAGTDVGTTTDPWDGGHDTEGAPTLPVDSGLPSCTPLPPRSDAATGIDPWRFQKSGVVRGLPSAAASGDGILSPAAAFVSSTLHLWFAEKIGTVHRMYHAQSRDRGVTFDDVLPVTGLRDSHVAAYPTVLTNGGRFQLWVGSGSFDYAESADGVAFEVRASRVLSAAGGDAFDALSVLYPTVAYGVSYTLWYTGFDGRRFSVGRATSHDGMTFVREPAQPVLVPGDKTDFDNHAVAQPAALLLSDRTVVFYGGYDTSKTNPGPYRVGWAESTDGVSFVKHGVVLPLGETGPDAWSTRDPAPVADEQGTVMLYVGMGDDGRYRLMRAVSETCGASR